MTSRFREIRAVLPVVLVWSTLFVASFAFSSTGFYGVGHWPDFLFVATCAAGMWMLAIWQGLFGAWHLARVVSALLFTYLFAFHASIVYLSGASDVWNFAVHSAKWAVIPLAIFLVVVELLRMLFRWRIVDCRLRNHAPTPRTTIGGVLTMVTVIAVLLGLGRTYLTLGDDPALETALYLGPVAAGVATLAVMSRMRRPLVWLFAVAATLSIAVGGFFLAMIDIGWPQKNVIQTGGPKTPEPFRDFLVPAATSYLLATIAVLAAATHLRNQRFLFRFGGTRGFAAPLETAEATAGVRRSAKIALGTATLAVVVVGGLALHRVWLERLSPIPDRPGVHHLGRLIAVASQGEPSKRVLRQIPRFMGYRVVRRHDLRAAFVRDRREAALQAIYSIGPDAVPFLLDLLSAGVRDGVSREYRNIPPRTGQERRMEVALNCLEELAVQDSLGAQKAEVLDFFGQDTCFAMGIDVLTHVGGDAVPIGLQMLRSTELGNRRLAIELLRETLNEDSDAEFLALANAFAEDDVASWHYDEYCRTFVSLDQQSAARFFLEVLADDDRFNERQRAAAAEWFWETGQEATDAVPLMVQLLKNSADPEVQRDVIRGLSGLGPAAADAAPVLLAIVKARGNAPPNPNATRQSIPGFAHIANGPFFDDWIWGEAMRTLGDLRSAEAVPELITLLSTSGWGDDVRRQAAASLGAIGPRAATATKALQAIVDSTPASFDEAKVRAAAILAIAQIHSARAEEQIAQTLLRLQVLFDRLKADGGDELVASSIQAELQVLAWLAGKLPRRVSTAHIAEKRSLSYWDIQAARGSLVEVSFSLKHFVDRGPRWYGIFTDWPFEPMTEDESRAALLAAAGVGLAADDAAARATAADFAAALSPRAASLEAELRACLQDEEPDVRARAAAALILNGFTDDGVWDALDESSGDLGVACPEFARILAFSRQAGEVESGTRATTVPPE